MADNAPKLSAALSEAQSIVEAAEQRAKALLAKAEEAYQQGYEQGYEAGSKQGRADAVESAVRLLEDSGAIGDRLAVRAADLALAIAGSVIGEQLAVDTETVKRIALRALRESIVGGSAAIMVNPEDKKLLEKFSDEFNRVAGGAAISIQADPDIKRGGCVIRSDFGEVDAQIDTLLDVTAARLGLSRSGTGSK